MTTESLKRGFYKAPLTGWVARMLPGGGRQSVPFLAVVLAAIFTLAVVQWGLPALAISAVVLTPVCLVLLVMLTVG